MERLTDKRMKGEGFIPVDHKEYKAILREEKPTAKQIYRRLLEIEDILGDDYDLDRLSVMMNQCMSMRDEVQARFRLTAKIPLDQLKDLVEAKLDGRCVVYQPGYVVASEYYKDGDFCIRETAGVISKKEYMDAVKGELESIESETHGEWLQYHDSVFHYCSNCLEDAMINRNTGAEELTSHCPNCGRKMKIHR